MKSVLVLICFFLMIVSSCSKSSGLNTVLTESNVSLTGRWKLIETLSDPGDGSGKWHHIDSTGYYVQFNSDSSFNDNFNNNFIPPSFDPIVVKFSVLNDSMINFIDSAANAFHRHYNIKKDTLTITGGCYEACGSRFKK